MPTASEIVFDLPLPTSTNRIWGYGRGRVFPSREYQAWKKEADLVARVALKQQSKISGAFRISLLFDEKCRGDGDNRIKAVLDWLQSRKIIRNDSDCRGGTWYWVSTDEAPFGCRAILTPL